MSPALRTLYPPLEPYVQHSLPVSPLHTLHVEECGRPHGLPVVFLHGGPGAGCNPQHRRFFDPERYRIVLPDQRGCGRSRPHAALEDNTLPDLVADLERIRAHLGIERWLVFGGSWGSTLGLAYAEAHPDRVLGLVLRGIFLCRPEDLDWFYAPPAGGGGAARLFPEAWADFAAAVTPNPGQTLCRAYHAALTGDDELQRMRAAKAWSRWEAVCSTLWPDPALEHAFVDPFFALAFARIESHYFAHGAFLNPDQLLRDADRLAGVDGVIVHGRYDVVCPIDQAWALHQAWPRAQLEVIDGAGHSVFEPGIVDALIRATDAFADRLHGPAHPVAPLRA